MDFIQAIQATLDSILQPILTVMLLGTGVFLTIRLGFIQFGKLGHGIKVTMGKYDDPSDPGDVSHFQALTTALSATVGIGNIAGVAIAIHFGGPGAVFWMWVTAVLGMATKYTEVALAQKYREIGTGEAGGTVAGGPMYYIEKGLGKAWKPMALFVAFFLMLTAMLSGNAIQANTVADLFSSEMSIPTWVTGACTALIVGAVILGGIKRIGRVTSIIAPGMAGLYVIGGLLVLVLNYESILPSFKLIFTEAFNPTAGVAGTGIGLFIQTMLWGVRRGLFSNEAGQGSAPIAHSAARTEEPVSEGVVALLEPLIDTLIICTMTALVIIISGVWNQTTPSRLDLASGDATYQETEMHLEADGIIISEGKPDESNTVRLLWHEVPVHDFYTDQAQTKPFSGKIRLEDYIALDQSGNEYRVLYGPAVENGAPLTQLAFTKMIGNLGSLIIILCVFLFAISTSISWCYYGDRCVHYMFGPKAIMPYKVLYVLMHFIGAVTSLNMIWKLGDTTLSLVTIPNVFALLLLSGIVVKMTRKYFKEKPYLD